MLRRPGGHSSNALSRAFRLVAYILAPELSRKSSISAKLTMKMDPRSRVDVNRELDTDTRPEASLRQDSSLVMKSTSRSLLWNILVTPILYLVDVPVHIPPSSNPSTARRRRPLSCGSVSRCAKTLASSPSFTRANVCRALWPMCHSKR